MCSCKAMEQDATLLNGCAISRRCCAAMRVESCVYSTARSTEILETIVAAIMSWMMAVVFCHDEQYVWDAAGTEAALLTSVNSESRCACALSDTLTTASLHHKNRCTGAPACGKRCLFFSRISLTWSAVHGEAQRPATIQTLFSDNVLPQWI